MRKKYCNLYSGLLGNVTLINEDEWEITNVEFDEKIHNQAKLLKPNQIHILQILRNCVHPLTGKHILNCLPL